MKEINSFGQAIEDPTRVRILAVLLRSELCVCELVDALEVSQSTLSSHLQVLRQTGIVVTRKEGRWAYYSLAKGKAAPLHAILALFKNEIGSDSRLMRDAKRIRERLALREDGRCTLGFTELRKSEVFTRA